MSKFNIPEPSIEIVSSPKFKLGDEIMKIEDLKHHTLAFSLEYACFNKTPISFDFKNTKNEDDHIDLLNFLSALSRISINELIERQKDYHFHEVDINKKYFLKTFLEKLFKQGKLDYSKMPTIYQIAYYDDDNAPRIVGFFGTHGLFYPLWWDFYHLIYYNAAYHNDTGFKADWFEQHLN